MRTMVMTAAVVFSVMGCVSQTPIATTSADTSRIAEGDRFRMQCVGAEGAMQVPIFARVSSYDTSNGNAELIVTDRDGLDGLAVAQVTSDTFSLFGASGKWSDDGRSVVLREGSCPGGFIIEKL